jgi:hypothetical protein
MPPAAARIAVAAWMEALLRKRARMAAIAPETDAMIEPASRIRDTIFMLLLTAIASLSSSDTPVVRYEEIKSVLATFWAAVSPGVGSLCPSSRSEENTLASVG